MFVPDSEVNDSDFSLPAPGWHRVEVAKAEKKRSKSASRDAYFNLELVNPDTKSILGWDVAMLEGKGNGIGIKKLAALGAATRQDGGWVVPDNPGEVVGCRGWAYFVHKEYTDSEGKAKIGTKVDIDHGEKGYLAEDDTPPSAEMPTADGTEDDFGDPFAEYAGSDAASTSDSDLEPPF